MGSRTTVAFLVLVGGILALLLWKYDQWVFKGLINNPIAVVLVVAGAVIWLVLTVGHSVNDPKRAVIFKEGRFDRVEPNGRMMLWPGTEVGTEISLAEQRVLGWPILAYDQTGKEVTVICAMTWRIVPTSTRPSVREQRMLLSTNDERRRLVIQAVESVIRDIARCTSMDDLKGVLTSAKAVEGIRQVASAQMEEDALTLDRLHVLRFIPPEKKDEPVPVKDKHEDAVEHHVTGKGNGNVTVQLPGPGGQPVTVQGNGEVTVESSTTRHREDTRGIRAFREVEKPDPKPDANLCCVDCGLPLDPSAPVLIVRYCRNCGSPVKSCEQCGKQKEPCANCGEK